MNRLALFRPFQEAFQGKQFKPTIILLVSPLLLVTWKYFGSPEYYLEALAPRLALFNDPAAAAAVYSFFSALLLMAVAPALVVKLVFRENLADYGVGLGDRARTVRSFLMMAPVLIIAAYVASRNAEIVNYYPINKSAGASSSMFGLHACTYLAFYLGWEFHFRGFLQYGLRDSLGSTNAVLLQVLASVLFHIDRPGIETFAAILAGIYWGMLAFRTRSLLSGLLQHALLGIALDWFICYG